MISRKAHFAQSTNFCVAGRQGLQSADHQVPSLISILMLLAGARAYTATLRSSLLFMLLGTTGNIEADR